MSNERRPNDDDYFEPGRFRTSLYSQGDLFSQVPLAYPVLGQPVHEEPEGARRFVSGPLEPGYAMLITPTCSMSAQQAEGYAHFVRTLVPVVPLSDLVKKSVIAETQLAFIRGYDPLIAYMYLPPHAQSGMPESMALLYMPITLDHYLLESTTKRTTQLAKEGARQYVRKMIRYISGGIERPRAEFNPPMD